MLIIMGRSELSSQGARMAVVSEGLQSRVVLFRLSQSLVGLSVSHSEIISSF